MWRGISFPLLLTATLISEEHAPSITVVAHEFVYAQRIDFVHGNGKQPFADEEQRRVQLVLALRAQGHVALLGWRALTVAPTVSDRGEALVLGGIQADGVCLGSHSLTHDPVAVCATAALPITRLPMLGVGPMTGSLTVYFSSAPASVVRFPITQLKPNQDIAVTELKDATFALSEQVKERLVFQFNAAAFLALQEIVFFNADGKEIGVRDRRPEWRDNRGQITWMVKDPAVATVELRYYRNVESRAISFTCGPQRLGMVVPGREELRGVNRLGAEDF